MSKSSDNPPPRPAVEPVRRRLLADIRPLKHAPEYRRLWIAHSLSALGTQMTVVAVPVQIFQRTGSTLAVGLLGVASIIPTMTIGLFGGSFADAVDRRKLVLATSTLHAVVAVAFLTQALLDLDTLWILYALVAVQSALASLGGPARRAFLPRLLDPSLLPAAVALEQLALQASRTAGPLIGGVLIAAAGVKTAYAVDALTFLIPVYAVWRLRPMPPQGTLRKPGLRAVAEGLHFLRRSRLVAAALLADLNVMIFGLPRALFPAMALRLGGGARVVGLLYAAPALGGLAGSVFSGRMSHVRRHGRAMLGAGLVWGCAVVGFGLTKSLWVAIVVLAVAGAADVVTVVFRSTIVQLNTPDELRGRIGSVEFVVGTGGPRLGDVEAGAVAALTTPAISAVSGGVACVVGVVALALAVPEFATFERRDDTASQEAVDDGEPSA